MSCSSCNTSSTACVGCSGAPALVGMGSLVGAPITNAQAREVIRQAWQLEHGRPPSEIELNYTQAIALFETGYGRIGQFARFAAEGKFNWGALQRRRNADGSCPEGTVPGSDSGNARCFLVFSTDVAAARRYIFELTKNPNAPKRTVSTLLAMQSGTPEDVASAMKIAPAWYETSIANYAAAIRNGLRNIQAPMPIGQTTGRPPSSLPSTSPSILPTLLLAGSLGFLGYLAYTRYGKRRRRT